MVINRPYSDKAIGKIVDYVYSELDLAQEAEFEDCLARDEILENFVLDLTWLVVSNDWEKRELHEFLFETQRSPFRE